MYNSKCGVGNPGDARFCMSCGCVLGGIPSPEVNELLIVSEQGKDGVNGVMLMEGPE